MNVPVPRHDYEIWKEMIRSEQVPPATMAAIFADDPAFAEWLRAQDGNHGIK